MIGSEVFTVIEFISATIDGVAGFRRLVPGGPSAGREFSDSITRLIGKSANPEDEDRPFSIFYRRSLTEVCAEQRRMHELRHRMRLLTVPRA
jgi:hypothetical protein